MKKRFFSKRKVWLVDHTTLFYTAYTITVLDYLFNKTHLSDLFSAGFLSGLSDFFSIVFFGLIAFDWFRFGKFSKTEFLKLIILVSVFSVSYYCCKNALMLKTICLIISSRRIDFVRFARYAMKLMVCVVILLAALSLLGAIGMGLRSRSTGQLRYALGFTHPNNLGLVSFELLAIYLFLKRNRKTVWNYIVCALVIIAVFLVTRSNTALVCSGLLLIAVFIYEKIITKIDDRASALRFLFRSLFLIAVLLLCAGGVYIWKNPDVLPNWGRTFSKRMLYARFFLEMYGIRLFGNNIAVGSQVVGSIRWLDSGYFRIPIEYGSLVAIILAFFFVRRIVLSIRSKDWILVIIQIMVLVYTFSEWSALLVFYNAFLATLPKDYGTDKGSMIRAEKEESGLTVDSENR